MRPTGRMVPLMASTTFLVVSPMAGPRGAPSTHERVGPEDKGATTQERTTQAVIPSRGFDHHVGHLRPTRHGGKDPQTPSSSGAEVLLPRTPFAGVADAMIKAVFPLVEGNK